LNNYGLYNQEGQVGVDYVSVHRLEEAFSTDLQCFSPDSFLADCGWVFAMDESGKLLTSVEIGDPEFVIAPVCFEPEHGQKVHWQAQENDYTLCMQVIQHETVLGYVGIVLPHEVEQAAALSYMNGFMCRIYQALKMNQNEKVSHLLLEVNRSLKLDEVMETIVTRIASIINKGDCMAVIFDEEQDIVAPCWSSSENSLNCWNESISRNSEWLLYQSILEALAGKELLTGSETDDLQLFGEDTSFAGEYVIVPLKYKEKTLGLLIVLNETGSLYTPLEQHLIYSLTKDLGFSIHNSSMQLRAQRDEQKRNMWFEITKKIHSSIDVDEVLHAFIDNVKKLYPQMQVDLWLSHDSYSSTLPVKQFTFSAAGYDVSAQAYMEARTIMVNSTGNRTFTLAAPLRGKQGVYGVLEVYTDRPLSLHEREVEYITMLADTAGNAFENAQLYRQSQNLIKELLLINEITQQLNRSIKMNDVLSFITFKLTEIFKTQYCCILHPTKDTEEFTIQAATNHEHINLSIKADGRLKDLLTNRESILIADICQGEQIFEPFAYRSFMAVPLVNGENVDGAILLMDKRPHFYMFDDFKRLEILAQHVRVAMTNASLHAEVERMVITDNLTGLNNRKYLYDKMAESQALDGYGSIILMDIDHFKSVNDNFGHQIGDNILIQVAGILKSSIRPSDIAARWGGEEMVIYLPRVNMEMAREVAERVRLKVKEQTTPQVTISSGVTTWFKEDERLSVEHVFQLADEALYEAKHAGRDRIFIASQS
jgi:diguanylate cyclase (GGDEF)-like protein